MESLLQDLRYGVRMLLTNPAFTAVAVISLALGIGANTAIFSLVDKILVRPLPVEEPHRLVTVGTRFPEGLNTVFNYPLYTDYRDRNQVFDGLIAYSEIPLSLSDGGQSERVYGLIVSGNYFSMLGVPAAVGRTFLPEEDRTPGTHPIAVISYRLWQRRFGAEPALLGKTIQLNGNSFSVIGIAPAEFTGTIRGFSPDVYVPMMMVGQAMPMHINPVTERRFTWLYVMGRLKPGIGREHAQAGMRTLAGQIAKIYPLNTDTPIELGDGGKGHTGLMRDLRTPLLLLMAVVGLILLIACANVGNLLIARAATRRREVAIRTAVGASRARLLRQLLTESLLLSSLGGIVGLLLAVWIKDLLQTFQPPSTSFPLALDGRLDVRVLSFALALSMITGVVFGLVPALHASRPDLVPALKEEAMTVGQGRRRWSVRNLLVVAQVALSLVVLVSAGLCVRSLRKLQSIDAGFEPAKVLVMSMDLTLNGYREPRGRQFYSQLVERVSALPGVESVSLARIVPLGDTGMRITVGVQGHPSDRDHSINFSFNIISPNYFQTMGTALLRGRDFRWEDREGAAPVVIINETIASRYWPGQDPVGKHLTLLFPGTRERKLLEIIGLVRNSKYRLLTEATPPTMFLPFLQTYRADMALHVRTAADPKTMAAAVRREAQSLDPNLPVFNIKTLEEQKRDSLYASRMAATLLAIFGLLALSLAAVGIYGVIHYSVSQRIHEIGIRMALGALGKDVLALVLSEGILLVAIGVMLGVAGAMAATRLFATFLYEVSATDPATFVSIALVLATVALLAAYIPARRATKVDPMVALRYE